MTSVNSSAQSVPHIVLLGGGHAHIQVLHALGALANVKTDPPPRFSVSLVTDVRYSPYSGMLPSYLAGDLPREALHFDLKDLCAHFGFHYFENPVLRIQAPLRQILLSDGQKLSYDIASINIGIRPRHLSTDQNPSLENPKDLIFENPKDLIFENPKDLYVKPISHLLDQWAQIVTDTPPLRKVTVVGGGAGAFELAIASRRRFSDLSIRMELITGEKGLLPEHPASTRRKAAAALRKHDIQVIDGLRVEKIDPQFLHLSDGSQRPRDLCLIGTSAEAPRLLRDSELPVSEAGFVKINEDLRVEGHTDLFATGDCAHFSARPLPKAGVFAVRQGPILSRNIITLLKQKIDTEPEIPLERYFPQTRFLTILNSGEKDAIASYGIFSYRGRAAWALKNRIDSSFMRKFGVPGRSPL